MKVIEHLEAASGPFASFEIIPPLRGGSARDLLDVIEDLLPYRPPFIDVTSHKAEVEYTETADGFQRKIKRKRPGTLGICALIQNKYDVDAVPHVLCDGFTREETEDFLIELKYLGIDNVVAVRGDAGGERKKVDAGRSENKFARDLVAQIHDMNTGQYLEEDLLDAERSDFCVGVGGYPEKHYEAPNLRTDVRHLKEKVDAGAHYVISQMCFDNDHFFRFEAECRAQGIDVPIIPGLKILTRRGQLRSIPKNFKVEIPEALADAVAAAEKGRVSEVGVEWALAQVRDLFDRGAPAAHFYVMSSATAACRILDKLDL
ncbi:MAG: methylenetetrahydrofolate reductase [Planctomycetota bacterium]